MTTIDRALLRASWRSWISSDGVRVGPTWLQWVWTLLFSAAMAVMFTALGLAAFGRVERSGTYVLAWTSWYGKNFIVCLTIAATCHVLFDLLIAALGGGPAIRGWAPWRRSVFFAGVPLLGVVIGWPLGVSLAGGNLFEWFKRIEGSNLIFASTAVLLGLISLVIHHFFATKSKQYEAERRATEAQLRLLQGQMEPHFMFNTLGTVLALIDGDAPQAKKMLEAFIDYLRASLGRLRAGDSTLGDELAMAEAYLSLMHMRMGDRLTFRVDVADPALRGAVLPPLLLQPLVENAIHHGLECKVEGGEVAVTVRRDGKFVKIEVADNGLGECERPARRVGPQGNGVALENLRSRLLARYGNDATLTLQLAPDAGARATLTLPFETTAA
jgi:signal transduction histidine kinase